MVFAILLPVIAQDLDGSRSNAIRTFTAQGGHHERHQYHGQQHDRPHDPRAAVPHVPEDVRAGRKPVQELPRVPLRVATQGVRRAVRGVRENARSQPSPPGRVQPVQRVHQAGREAAG